MEKNALVITNLQPTITKEIATVVSNKKALEKAYTDMTKELKQSMEINGIYSYEDENITISYTCASNPISIDLDKLKTQYPDVYADCLKVGNRGSSITIKAKINKGE